MRGERAIGVAPHQSEQVFAPHVLDPVRERLVGLERGDEGLELLLVTGTGAHGRGADHLQTDLQLHVEIFRTGVHAFVQIAVPRQEVIDPALDGEGVEAQRLDEELRVPAVVRQRQHPDLPRLLLRLVAVTHHRGDQIVAVGEDIRLRRHDVADDTLRREAAVVDRRCNVFDDDSFSTVELSHSISPWCESRSNQRRSLRANGRTRAAT